MKQKSIWVIERGLYSDYRVVGVFSSKANAELALSALGTYPYEPPSIAEWSLDPGVKDMQAGRTRWRVHMLRDGTTERVEQVNNICDFANEVDLWERSKAPYYRGKNVPDVLTANVWARDSKHAIKIVNEIRTQRIANNEWPGA